MIKKILVSIKDGTFFKKVKNKVKSTVMRTVRKSIYKRTPVQDNKIIFLTFQGNYSCNPKALCEYIIKNKLPYELVWVVRKENLLDTSEYPIELKLVVRNSIEFYKEAASAKYIVDNANNFIYMNMIKKEEQILLQPWHGSMGFKKIDPSSNKNEKWVKRALMLDDITDYCIVNSKFEEEVFRTSYWPTTDMLNFGHPRNDMLFNLDGEFKKFSKKIKEQYGIDSKTKIVLYAPTFRDDASLESYNLDYERIQKAFEKRFGGKWVIFVRFHFKLKNMKIPKKYLKKVVNVTDYPDIQELMCACDAGVTDYSSWLCDYVLTRRPAFLYTSDIEKYVDERGFYYPLETSPFPVCKDNDAFEKAVLEFDDKKYQKDVDKFLKDKKCYETGHACEKVLKKMEEINKKNK